MALHRDVRCLYSFTNMANCEECCILFTNPLMDITKGGLLIA